ncbi:MAG: DNA glycosylase AlkZ-like family protein [Mycobacterium leprae]
MTLTVAEIRRQAISRTLFAPTSIADAIAQVGFVQIDPMAAPARAQDLILRHRVADYRRGDLARAYPTLPIDEDLIHVYGVMPAESRRLLYPRAGQWRVEREYPGLADQVLAYIQENGPTHHRALDAHFQSERTRGSWGNEAKATTKILEMLQYRGQIRVARREGNVRVYVAAPPPEPTLAPSERLRALVLLLARLYAPITLPTLRNIVRCLGWSAPSLPEVTTAVADLLESGDLEREKVDKLTYVWPAGEWIESPTEAPRVVRLLAPFDPLVWDRARFEHLWGWPYRLEQYTPAKKRQFGRYALPMLWGETVIGWVNAELHKGKLHATPGFIGRILKDPVFLREYEAELERLRLFLEIE